MKKINTYIGSASLAAYGLLHAIAAKAQSGAPELIGNLEDIGEAAYGSGTVSSGKTLPELVGALIKQAMGLLGVILVIIVIYAGFLWMTAGGSEEKVTKAKGLLKNAIIGIVIVFLAYSITAFVVGAIVGSTGFTG